ncbi:MAG: 6,7-dimethyl-8-ribityllumazine synthase [bacterium]
MSTNTLSGDLNAKGLKFGIAVGRFNDLFTKNLLEGAMDCLVRHGASDKDVTVVWVPGSFEIPFALKKLADAKQNAALIALGVVIQGATGHAGIINQQVARACSQISLESGIPVIDGVIGVENLEQAMERCGTKHGNRGWNAAQAAIEMANLARKL